MRQALDTADCDIAGIDAFTSTFGPGLSCSLLIGNVVAKALAVTAKRPYARPSTKERRIPIRLQQ
jgi:tRNA A37 threonylcarbamoyltransferase TsaD